MSLTAWRPTFDGVRDVIVQHVRADFDGDTIPSAGFVDRHIDGAQQDVLAELLDEPPAALHAAAREVVALGAARYVEHALFPEASVADASSASQLGRIYRNRLTRLRKRVYGELVRDRIGIGVADDPDDDGST